jgi:hypothetical protein
MALRTFSGSFQISTGAAGTVQNIPASSAIGSLAKFIDFSWNGRTNSTNSVGRATHQFGVGRAINAAVAYPNYCVTTKSQDGQATSNTASDVHEFRSIYTILAGSNAADGEADVTAFNSDGSFDVTIRNQFSAAITVHYKVFYGTDILQMQTLLTTEPVSPGTVNMVFSFDPDYLSVLCNPSGPLTTGISDDSRMTIGAATFRNKQIQQFVLTYGANDNVATMQTQHYNRNDQFIAHIDSGFAGGLTGAANISAKSGATVTLNWTTTSGGGNREHIVFAVRGGSWYAGNFNTVPAGNNIVVTNIDFVPRGATFYSDTRALSTLGATDAIDERVVGMFDSVGASRSLSIEDQNGVADSLVDTVIQFDSVHASCNGTSTPAIDARITYTSTQVVAPYGFTLAQPLSDLVGSKVYYVTYGDTLGQVTISSRGSCSFSGTAKMGGTLTLSSRGNDAMAGAPGTPGAALLSSRGDMSVAGTTSFFGDVAVTYRGDEAEAGTPGIGGELGCGSRGDMMIFANNDFSGSCAISSRGDLVFAGTIDTQNPFACRPGNIARKTRKGKVQKPYAWIKFRDVGGAA